MERIILIIVAGIFTIPNFSAQSQSIDIEPAPGKFIEERTPEQWYESARELEIWGEDFDSGIPESWTNEEVGGIATWEYRGPDTTPGIDAGSRGSCIEEGESAGPPIQSDSWVNGFVIFDSNYWDDNIGPCGNMGAGPAPAPHSAYLTTESIDLSAYDKVGVLFTQYHKNWAATTELQVSVDGGAWDTVIANSFAANESSELGHIERKNITEYVGGESDVRLRFAFEGQYYFWMLDDIILFELDDNNLIVQSATYGDYNEFGTDIIAEMEKLEYSQYPDEMPPRLYFTTEVSNYGAEVQNQVKLHASVINETTLEVIHTDSSEGQGIGSDNTTVLELPPYQMPSIIGDYQIDMYVQQLEEDQTPDDNEVTKYFEITDVTYARDELSTDGIYVPASVFNGDSYEMGNFFYITDQNQSLYSVSVGVGLGSITETEIHGALYTMDFDSFETTLIAESEPQEVYWEALNGMEDNKTMVLNFDTPVALDVDQAYLLMVVCPSGPEDVLFATSGDCPPFSSMVRFGSNQWFYMVRTPMVRMNFGEVISVDENLGSSFNLGQNYPNPFNEMTLINYSLEVSEKVSFIVYDVTGKSVLEIDEGVQVAGEHSLNLSSENLLPGVYSYTMNCGNDFQSKTMIIVE